MKRKDRCVLHKPPVTEEWILSPQRHIVNFQMQTKRDRIHWVALPFNLFIDVLNMEKIQSIQTQSKEHVHHS